MKTVTTFLTLVSLAVAGIEEYDWPQTAEILSENYTVRVREIGSVWQSAATFSVKPRDYANYTHGFDPTEFTDGEHDICGGDGMTSFLKDRAMAFTPITSSDSIEIEVTKKFGSAAPRVEIAPKEFGINPYFFDGRTAAFRMATDQYVSVNFVTEDNQDDDRYGGKNIRNGLMIFADLPEGDHYDVPLPTDPGVVVWSDSTPLSEIRSADIIYFPAGDHRMKAHRENEMAFITTVKEMEESPLYHGQLRLNRSQKIYLAGGAYVRGAFKSNGIDDVWLYGRGIVSGRDHLMHEILIPEIVNGEWIQKTQTKEAFVDFVGSNGANLHGVAIIEPFHHTCPSGNRSVISDIKIIGWCSNNDGIRPGEESVVEHIFIKSSDDYDYARGPHTVSNSLFWPGVNGALGMIGWNNLGTGYAEYHNNYVINAEWSGIDKRNSGVLGSMAKSGIQLVDNVVENMVIENPTSYLVNLEIDPGNETGHLRNFQFRNIVVEYPFQLPNGTASPQKLQGSDGTEIRGFTFTNLIVDGRLVTWENHGEFFDLALSGTNGSNSDAGKNVHDILFNSEGILDTVIVSVNGDGSHFPQGENGKILMLPELGRKITFVPQQGNKITSVIVNGENRGRVQTLHFDTPGNHKVEVHFEPGDDYFNLEKKPVLLSDVSSKRNLTLYSIGKQFMIEAHSAGEYSLELYTLSGRQLVQKKITLNSGENIVSFEHLSVGTNVIYVSLKGENVTLERKLLVK